MSGSLTERLSAELAQIEAEGLTKPERVIASPQGGVIDAEPGGRVLNFCANNYLGLADHPALVAGRQGRARALGLRHGLGALHLRHAGDRTRSWRRGSSDFLGIEDTILYSSCFDANGGLFETLLGRRGRDHLRRAEPRLDHRRRPAVQGPALPLRQHRHGRPRAQPEARPRAARHRMIATDGVFSMDGDHRQAAGHLRAGRQLRRPGHGRRLPRRRLPRAERARHARALRGRGPRRHPHRHLRQGAGRRHRAASPAAGARSSPCCGSARGPISSPTRWRRRSPPPRCAALDLVATRATPCATGWTPTPPAFARDMTGAGFTLRRRAAPDHPGDARRRPAGPGLRRARCSSSASTSSASPSRWCRAARPASAPRCRRRTPSRQIEQAVAAFTTAGRELGVIVMTDTHEGPGQDAARARPRLIEAPVPGAGAEDVLIAVERRARSAAPTSTSGTGTSGRRRPCRCR